MNYKLLWFLLLVIILSVSQVESIVGGHTSQPDAAPFMVSIQNPTHICGGVLVGDQWVLTTAACVQSKTNLAVLAGSHRLLTNKKRVSVEESGVIIHEEYNATSGINNVALLKLVNSVVAAHVSTIPMNADAVNSGASTIFYGWGSLSYGSSAKSNELQTLYQKSLSAADCATKLSGVGGLQTGHICAHIQQGQAACSKDQGGPLVSYTSNTLLGIYSYGVQCSGNYPDVFVDVSKFKAWVDAKMA